MAYRVLRHEDCDELVADAAQLLLDTLVQLQASQDTVHLCLTGGTVANRVYEVFADLVPDSGLDPTRLHLWWGDDGFVPTTDPQRASIRSLSILARTLQLSSSQTHPIPPSDGKADPDEAAYAYAADLADTTFDICLLGVGADGHVAAVFPGHPSSEPTSPLVVGVSEAPQPPSERTTLTVNAINRSQRVWLWASGEEKASAVARALAGDERLPAAQVRGVQQTLWFVDEPAAEDVPQYRCSF